MKDIKALSNSELVGLIKEMRRIDNIGLKDRRMVQWSTLLNTCFNNHVYKDHNTGQMREGSWIRTWTNIRAFMEKDILRRVLSDKLKIT